MRFYVYHHNDFDGIASAAIFSKFLNKNMGVGFSDCSFFEVDYDLKDKWYKYNIKNPSVVLDFLYHYKVDWWFDHHDSTFINKASILNPYVRSNKKYWNTGFDSCPSLLLEHFRRYYKKEYAFFKKEYHELIQWSDIIDGAKYRDPADLYNYDNIYININKTLSLSHKRDYVLTILKSFYDGNVESIKKNENYKQLLSIAKSKDIEAIEAIKNIIEIDNKIAFFDQSNYDFPFQRFLAYYLYPKILYRIAIFKKDNQFSISINFNNWLDFKNKVNLGEICKLYGGGGRKDVGGVISDNHASALITAGLIKEKLISLINEKYIEQLKLF